MRTAAIVAEYNPFHNGHAYHIRRTREYADAVVCIMSGSFVQRGDTAVMDKRTRANEAVACGADLVIELPCAFAASAADRFARGAVELIKALGCVDYLSFGCESDDVGVLLAAAEFMKTAHKNETVKRLLQSGEGFPAAAYAALNELDPAAAQAIRTPNNLLAAEYLSYLPKEIGPLAIKRTGASHDGRKIQNDVASAAHIRELMRKGGGWERLVPRPDAIKDAPLSGGLHALSAPILYKLRTATRKQLEAVPDSDSGIASRLFAAKSANSLEQLLALAGTKRYTAARIRRAVVAMLLDIDGSYYDSVPYIRPLAATARGASLLKNARLPVSHSLRELERVSPTAKKTALLEARASAVYGLSLSPIDSGLSDYTHKFALYNGETV